MTTKQRIFTCSAITIALAVGGISVTTWANLKTQLDHAKRCGLIEQRLSYYEQAERLNMYYFTAGEKTSAPIIRQTLEAIDKLLPRYFPDGPYNRKDIIALAMVESGFDQYLVGTHKEFGIFQIMPEMCKDLGIKRNQFDVEINTDMALAVLRDKFNERKDYKKAIIAYNGYVVKANGKVSDTYWKRFLKYRRTLDDVIPDTNPN